MWGEPVPLSVYRMASDDLVKEYRSLYRRCDRLTPREAARFYFVNEEMRARGLGHGIPTPDTHEGIDAWDGEI